MATQSLTGRRRHSLSWVIQFAGVVAVVSVGMWLGSTAAQRRTTFPTLVSRTRTGFQQLQTAVRKHFGLASADATSVVQRPASAHPSRPPRVVPLRPTGRDTNPQLGQGRR